MADNKKVIELEISGMECTSCEKIIERTVKKIDGVSKIKVDYITGKAKIKFDADKTSLTSIKNEISKKGYYPSTGKKSRYRQITLILGSLVLLLGASVLYSEFSGYEMPAIDQNTSILLLFTIGLLTGFHCIAMCGPLVIGYSTKQASKGIGINYKSHIAYGLSKTLSYAIIGGIFGLIGSFFTFTPFMRGMAAVLAGLFLIFFGLNMLNLLKWFRRFRLKTPKTLETWVITKEKESKSPIIIGLLNGLMIACGPLQAVYILAASTGSAYYGFVYLAAFGLGTLPVLLGFGILTSIISSSLTHKIVRYSGVVVIILGMVMLNRGLSLTGSGYDMNTVLITAQALEDDANPVTEVKLDSSGFQEISMEVNRYGWKPDKFVLKKGVPVKWIIEGKELNNCNNAIQVPKLNLEFDIKKGVQTIEFTPDVEGIIPWSCWMGMIPGVFVVKDDINIENQVEVEAELESIDTPPARSCGGGCGGGGGCGCGCGGR